MQKILKITQKGFTLLEIIATLVVMGILAVIAVSRSFNYNVEVYSGADTLKMHLRYAQTLAMNSNPNAGDSTIWGISCDGANAYWLFQNTDPAAAANFVRLPDDDKYINAAGRTINLNEKKISVNVFTVLFDNRGIPYTAYPDTPLLGNLPITVTGGGTTVNVTITPLTGYIP